MVAGLVSGGEGARRCPALLISAPASGQGKTTVTAALARRQRQLGRRVRVFKTGPDFLDPMILERASHEKVYQLDLWLGGEDHCRQLLYDASQSDLLLIEGVMGLFDGRPSSADLATLFRIPVLAVIDGSAMAQTFGAIAFGLTKYRDDLRVVGVVANRLAGQGHYQMVSQGLPPGLRGFGWLPGEAEIRLPDRHLGLVQAGEIEDLDVRLDRMAERLTASDEILALPPTTFTSAPNTGAASRRMSGIRVAVARDAAFSFLYHANLDVLQRLGATVTFFSPLQDRTLPQADALYLPGGYPELHLDALHENRDLRDAIRAHHGAGKPIVAECGGLLYLLESLTDASGRRVEMIGLLPGHAVMQERLTAIALQQVALPEGELRGHTFHHSRLDTPLTALACGACPNGGKTAEPVFRDGRLTASYIHVYFPSNPRAVGELFAP